MRHLFLPDARRDDSDDSKSDDEDIHLALPAGLPADARADAFAIIPALCRGKHDKVDMFELRGGICGMSRLALRRDLSPGGNLDKIALVDLGDPEV